MVEDSTQQIFRGIPAYFCSLRQCAQQKSGILSEILKLEIIFMHLKYTLYDDICNVSTEVINFTLNSHYSCKYQNKLTINLLKLSCPIDP